MTPGRASLGDVEDGTAMVGFCGKQAWLAVRDRDPAEVRTALGLRDLSRVDAVVDVEGRVQLLEVNTSPGMTETSLLPMAVEAGGLSFGQVLRTLLEQAAARG